MNLNTMKKVNRGFYVDPFDLYPRFTSTVLDTSHYKVD